MKNILSRFPIPWRWCRLMRTKIGIPGRWRKPLSYNLTARWVKLQLQEASGCPYTILKSSSSYRASRYSFWPFLQRNPTIRKRASSRSNFVFSNIQRSSCQCGQAVMSESEKINADKEAYTAMLKVTTRLETCAFCGEEESQSKSIKLPESRSDLLWDRNRSKCIPYSLCWTRPYESTEVSTAPPRRRNIWLTVVIDALTTENFDVLLACSGCFILRAQARAIIRWVHTYNQFLAEFTLNCFYGEFNLQGFSNWSA